MMSLQDAIDIGYCAGEQRFTTTLVDVDAQRRATFEIPVYNTTKGHGVYYLIHNPRCAHGYGLRQYLIKED
jgi:hypothetical protein